MASFRYRVLHETHYTYSQPVVVSRQITRLAPRDTEWQRCEAHSLAIEPAPAERAERRDYFGNRAVQFALLAPHRELTVLAESLVAVEARTGLPDPQDTPPWERVAAALRAPDDAESLDASQFVFASPHVPLSAAARELAQPLFQPNRPILSAVIELTRLIHRQFRFDPGATTVATPLEEVIAGRRGVCQDFAHLAVACLRAMGLAARYVSGYLLTTPPPGRPRLIGADASHAWLGVYVPGAGWIDADPTNDMLPDTDHITLGWGRDFADVSPLSGVILGGGEHEVVVRVTVHPLTRGADDRGVARVG